MAGQQEQKRRAFHVNKAAEEARKLFARQVLALLDEGGADLVKGFCQAELGMVKPLKEVRKELRRNSETANQTEAEQ